MAHIPESVVTRTLKRNFPKPRPGASVRHQLGPAEWLTALLAGTGSGTDGRQWQCPAHPDATPSLSVREGQAGQALVICRAGCAAAAVLATLRLGTRALYQPPRITPDGWITLANVAVSYPPLEQPRHGRDPGERLESVHDYGGRFLLERWRSASGRKRLAWCRRGERGEWIPGLGGTPLTALPLYQSAQARMGAAVGETLYVVESESSVDALMRAGHYSTTWAGGASSPPLAKLAYLLGNVADLRVVADHDEPGIRCARRILAALEHATGWLPPRPGGDVRDVLPTDPRLSTLLPLERHGADS